MFLGGIAWVGAHDLDPSRPLARRRQAARHPGRVARLEMALHLPRARHRQRQPPRRAGRHAAALRLTSAGVMNSFFVPQLGSQIYAMAGMATRLYLQADKPGQVSRPISAQFSGEGFSDMRFVVEAVPADAVRDLARQHARHRREARRRELWKARAGPAWSTSPSPSAAWRRACSNAAIRNAIAGDVLASDVRKAYLGRDPVHPAHPDGGIARW